MNKCLIVSLLVMATYAKSHGQTYITLAPITQLYVVVVEDKKFITNGNEIETHGNNSRSSQKIIDFIQPDWIESVHVYKGEEATDLYGAQGKNGVILLQLKKESFAEMKEEDKIKFK